MSANTWRIVTGIRDAEDGWARDIRTRRRRWRHGASRGQAWLDREVRIRHRKLRQSVPAFLRQGSIRNAFTVPIIYSLAVPLLLLDVWITIYQSICFPIYGIARVRRRSHFVIDRHKLGYLNAIEKAHCMYCSYAIGVITYVREVAARTEQYWCPIKHATPIPHPHSHYQQYLDYGDADGYRRELPELRRRLRPSAPRSKSAAR